MFENGDRVMVNVRGMYDITDYGATGTIVDCDKYVDSDIIGVLFDLEPCNKGSLFSITHAYFTIAKQHLLLLPPKRIVTHMPGWF